MRRLLALPLAALLAASCAKREEAPEPPAPAPAPAREARFYFDLGPEKVDVSAYPPAQRENYKLFLSVCSSCHTPARALNAPYAEEAVWRRFVRRMHVKMEGRGVLSSEADERRVLDFLAYDSARRKVEGKAAFEAEQERLKKEFAAR